MPERDAPDPYFDAFTGLVAARALMTAVLLGVFDALHERPATALELADRLRLDRWGADALLTALTAMGYLRFDGAVIRNAPVSTELLVRSSPHSIADFVGGLGDLHWQILAPLPTAVRDGQVYAMHERRRGDGERWESYIRGLYEIYRNDQDANAALVPVDDARRLVDVAGGHAGFSIAMCRRHPRLTASVVDLPPSAAVGRRIVAEQGYAERVTFREGDVFDVGLGDPADVVSVFNLVHHLSEERDRELCRMARASLRPGGFLVIGDSALPEPGERVSEQAAISSLLFYAWSHGRNFRPSEIQRWMVDAGFSEIVVHRNARSPWRAVVIGRA
jgi:SAM-dependent methyltransferase